MKILVISLAGIGDTLLATPLMHELRANFPEAQVDALVLWPGSKDILQGNPHLNTVYQRDFVKTGKLESLRFLRMLRGIAYDASINTHPQSRIHYRVIARLINARTRISHRYECSGILDRWLVNRLLPQDYTKHTVENNLAVLPLLGARPLLPQHAMEVFLTPAELAWAESFVAAQQLAGRTLLGVHMGSGATKNLALKRWPLDQYLALARELRKARPDVTLLLFGGPEEEQEMARLLAEAPAPFAVRARTRDLRQAAALMKRCAAFLSVDTALMHLAAAVRTRGQMVIEAPTLNATNLPYGNPYRLIRNPAVAGRNLEYYRYDGRGIQGTSEELRRCMEAVTVDAVAQAVGELLGYGGAHER